MAAAAMHAGWNALLKGGGDPFDTMARISLVGGAIASVAVWFVKWPVPAAWPWLGLSLMIHAGRGRVRRALFAAALPAAFHWNAALIVLYRRLTERGKAHKATLIACARKLLVFANTVLHRDTPWVAAPVRI